MLFLALTIAAAHTKQAHTDAAGHLIECSKVEPTTKLRCRLRCQLVANYERAAQPHVPKFRLKTWRMRKALSAQPAPPRGNIKFILMRTRIAQSQFHSRSPNTADCSPLGDSASSRLRADFCDFYYVSLSRRIQFGPTDSLA